MSPLRRRPAARLGGHLTFPRAKCALKDRRGRSSGGDGPLDFLGRREMLVRRAVAVVRQRDALAGRALAGGRATLERIAVNVVAVLRLAVQPLHGELDE